MYLYWPVDSNAVRREHKHCISLASTGSGDKQLLFSLCPLLLHGPAAFVSSQEWTPPMGYREATSFLLYSIISSEPALILPPSSLSLLKLCFRKEPGSGAIHLLLREAVPVEGQTGLAMFHLLQ